MQRECRCSNNNARKIITVKEFCQCSEKEEILEIPINEWTHHKKVGHARLVGNAFFNAHINKEQLPFPVPPEGQTYGKDWTKYRVKYYIDQKPSICIDCQKVKLLEILSLPTNPNNSISLWDLEGFGYR